MTATATPTMDLVLRALHERGGMRFGDARRAVANITPRAAGAALARLMTADPPLVERHRDGVHTVTEAGRAVLAEGRIVGQRAPCRPARLRPRKRSGRDRIWAAVRTFGIGGQFKAADIAALARESVDAASTYLRRLAEVGVLKRLHKRATDGGYRYAVVCDLGVQAPVMRQTHEGWVVYDPNAREELPCRAV